jgi:uncharacterized protein YggE
MSRPNTLASKAHIALAAVLILAAAPAWAQTSPQAPSRTLSIAGIAEVHAVPDTAVVTLRVVTENEAAAAALNANSAALTKVLGVIRSFGVESKDLQTVGLSLQPHYYRPEKPTANDQPRIIGYTATDGVLVRVHDLGKVGDILDKVATAGANRIDGIAFVVSKQERLLDDARRNAVADAKSKADLYAQAAGFTLGKVMSLTEENAPTFQPVARAMVASAPAGIAVPIEAGEMTLSMRVHMVWSLAD